MGGKTPFEGGEPFGLLRQLAWKALCKRPVGEIQGFEDQIRRAGGTKKRHGSFGLGQEIFVLGSDVQIRPAGEHRQGFMRRITA